MTRAQIIAKIQEAGAEKARLKDRIRDLNSEIYNLGRKLAESDRQAAKIDANQLRIPD